MNLWVTPLSLDIAGDHWQPAFDAYEDWALEDPSDTPTQDLPVGPSDGMVPDTAMEAALNIAGEVCEVAGVLDDA